ncbi:MAG: SMI1/KNR4 family protein [Halanaerobiales bacterium]|nr:SMI1/KNR4 family protein [Halanaerobiales bacterium]
MNINEFISKLDFNGVGLSEKIREIEEILKVIFPDEYKEFMLKYNGGEGEIGENNYLVVWPLEELIELNEEYAVNEFAPGLFLFGSDGGSVAYAFDTRKESIPIVEVPFIGMDLDDISFCSNTFNVFLEYLYKSN